MANRYPLILDTTDGNKIKELPAGDNLYLRNNNITDVQDITALGTIEAGNIVIAGKSLFAQGFTELQDVPPTYEGSEGFLVRVKPDGTGLEFSPQNALGSISVSSITMANDLVPTVNDSGQIGTNAKRFNEVNATSIIGDLRARDGTLLIDVEEKELPYGIITGAPTSLSEFTNDVGYQTLIQVRAEILAATEAFAVGEIDITGSVFADDSSLLVDGVNGNLVTSKLQQDGATDGQALVWSDANNRWEPGAAVGAGVDLTAFSVVQAAPGTASLAYNNLSGVFNYTPPDLSGYLTIADFNNQIAAADFAGITTADITNWNTAYGWGDHSTAGYALSTSVPTVLTDLSIVDGTAGQVLQANGDGTFTFITLGAIVESDPVVGAVNGIVKADGAGNISAAVAGTDYSTFDGNFSSLSGTPTTIAGYGITDAFNGTFTSLIGKPTTIAGYGITDAFDGAYSSLTGTPTTLAGYGITDAFDGAFSSLSGKPTTLLGYGITDNILLDGADISVGEITATGLDFSGTGIITLASGSNIVLDAAAGVGNIVAGGSRITNVGTPTSGTDATTKSYVDGLFGNESYLKFGTSTSFNPGNAGVAAGNVMQQEGGGDIAVSVTVTSGFTNVLVTLDAAIWNLTDSTTEAEVSLQRQVNSGGWTTVRRLIFPVADTYYGNAMFQHYDTHGASAGDTVAYRIINSMDVSYSSEQLRLVTGMCGDTMGVKEV